MASHSEEDFLEESELEFGDIPTPSFPPSKDDVIAREQMKAAEEDRAFSSLTSHSRISPSLSISENTAEVFVLNFSPDGKLLAAGCGDGSIRVFHASSGRLAYTLQSGSNVALPTTAILFRPVTAATRTKNVLVAANAAGTLQHWHVTSGKCLNTMTEEDNQILSLAYNEEGTMLATGGKDTAVRVYDEATKSLVTCMRGGSGHGVTSAAGHSNRIFSVKFHPDQPNMIVSGGWDNTVQIWDIRTHHAVRSFYGPHISGDALDIRGDEILTGSYRSNDVLELWDWPTGKKMSTVKWGSSSSSGSQPCNLYAAAFSRDTANGVGGRPRYIAAGGSGTNEVRVFDHHHNDALVGTLTGLVHGIYTVAFAPYAPVPAGSIPPPHRVAVGGGDAAIRIVDIVDDAATATSGRASRK